MNKVRVPFVRTVSVQEVTAAEYDLVHSLYNIATPRKVEAIKFIRHQYNLGLADAKHVCDAIGAKTLTALGKEF
jgi:ribosomal protein L7/L12